jgi:TPP-dependent indolepyruvate ferredoxin oxidoreductase alpha subunit
VWTYPLPEEGLRRWLRGARAVEVRELGSPFVHEKVRALACRLDSRSVDWSAGMDLSARFVVSTAFDALYEALRSFPDRVVCGDLGSFTMDPARTIDACLCYGASVAVAIGCSLARPAGPVFCVTGDAAFLHSGQACLEEGQTRGARLVVVVLDNCGARSTGGQTIPSTLRPPPGLPVHCIEHARATPECYRVALTRLVNQPGVSLLRVRC